jgi:hypothetical protein
MQHFPEFCQKNLYIGSLSIKIIFLLLSLVQATVMLVLASKSCFQHLLGVPFALCHMGL